MFRSATLSSHTFDEYINIEENPKVNYNLFGQGAVISQDGLIGACSSGSAVTVINAANGEELNRLDATANGFSASFGFGMSMDFNGNILSVDDSRFSSNSGRVILFNPKTGALIDTLSNPRSGVQDLFGYRTSLSADGSRIAIGNPLYRNAPGTSVIGVCHVFSLPSKTLITTIANPLATSSNFGQSISLSGDGSKLAVGSPQAAQGGIERGRVDIFNAATGALLRTITSPNPNDNNFFGQSVSLNYDGTSIGIGESSSIYSGTNNDGTAYLFDVGTGSLLLTYPSPNPSAYEFGQSISLSGDGSTLIIGSKLGSGNSGVMYFFTTRDSTPIRTIPLPGVPGNPSPGQGGFGTFVNVSHDGKRIVTGAPTVGVNNFSGGDDYTGRFYIYNFSD